MAGTMQGQKGAECRGSERSQRGLTGSARGEALPTASSSKGEMKHLTFQPQPTTSTRFLTPTSPLSLARRGTTHCLTARNIAAQAQRNLRSCSPSPLLLHLSSCWISRVFDISKVSVPSVVSLLRVSRVYCNMHY